MTTFNNFSCSIAVSLALHADQYDAHRMVPTAINHKNTSATSTTGRRGEYNCTETAKNKKSQKHNRCQFLMMYSFERKLLKQT